MNKRTIITLLAMLVWGTVLFHGTPVSASTYSAAQYSGNMAADGSIVIGEEAVVYFAIDKNPGLYAGSYTLTYDTGQLQYMGCSAMSEGSGTLIVANEKKAGSVSIAFVSPNIIGGTGNLVAMRFQTKRSGNTKLQIDDLRLTDPDMKELSLAGAKTYTLSVADLEIPTLTVKNTADSLQLTWKKIRGAAGYYVYRKSGNGKYSKIKQISSPDTVSYKDKSVKSGTVYTYTVRAFNRLQTGNSAAPKTNRFLAPVKLSKPKNTGKGIRLSWKKVTGAKGYYLYRKVGNGAYKKLAKIKGASKVSYLDKKVSNKKKYTYKVVVYNGKSLSVDSNKKKITCKKK